MQINCGQKKDGSVKLKSSACSLSSRTSSGFFEKMQSNLTTVNKICDHLDFRSWRVFSNFVVEELKAIPIFQLPSVYRFIQCFYFSGISKFNTHHDISASKCDI